VEEEENAMRFLYQNEAGEMVDQTVDMFSGVARE
jgi:hypothetical protein